MVNSRALCDLHPTVMKMCMEFMARCKEVGIDILITSTYRDHESQNALYAQGRTTKGNKVTNAKGGQSFHNWKVAFDFAPIRNGKIDWQDSATFKRCGEIAESVGLEWAGRWKSFPELAHCQFTGGLSLADFQAGKKIS
ncbi:MAG: M15 family metallopeptidase [Halobacteriota archaeon]